jgi:hypothetical protein
MRITFSKFQPNSYNLIDINNQLSLQLYAAKPNTLAETAKISRVKNLMEKAS